MADKADNAAMRLHPPEKTGTRHTDHQWKVEGGEGRGKTTKHSTQNALSSCHTGKNALQP